MLRKIDCVMVHVDDLDAGAAFYTRTLGLRVKWRDDSSIGLALPESETEVVLHTLDLPPDFRVHYLVDDVRAAVSTLGDRVVRQPPFEIAVGWCAVLEDPFGNPVCVLDLTKGVR